MTFCDVYFTRVDYKQLQQHFNNDTTLLTDPEQPPDESQSVQVKVLIKELHDLVLFHRKKIMKTQKRLLR